MPSWPFAHTLTTPADPAALWARLIDVARWPDWDHEVVSASLDGPLAVGATGRLRPRGRPAASFEITVLDEQRRFTDVSRLPLGRMEFDHRIEPLATGGTSLSHQVTISGPLTPLFARVIGRRLAAGLPSAMAELAALASVR